MKETLAHDGLPPLEPSPSRARTVVFTNLTSIYLRDGTGVRLTYTAPAPHSDGIAPGVFVSRNGQIACASPQTCAEYMDADAEYVDLQGGSVGPGLVSAGSALGVQEIDQELSTQDGYVFDPLSGGVPEIVGGASALIRAADGLQFGTRDAL